jgi:hypothetical protein
LAWLGLACRDGPAISRLIATVASRMILSPIDADFHGLQKVRKISRLLRDVFQLHARGQFDGD